VAGGVHVALHVVGIHAVGAEGDGVGGDVAAGAVVLGHHVGAGHAAGFADVELGGPAVVVGEFVAGEAPAGGLGADFFGDARVVGEGPEQALGVGEVGGADAVAGGVVGLGVGIVFADEVGGEAGVVIGVGLAVRHVGRVEREDFQASLEVAEKELVVARIVTGGLGKWDAVGGGVGEAEAEIVGLDLGIGGAFDAGAGGGDAGEEAAGGIAGHDVGGDTGEKLVGLGLLGLDAVEGFAELGVGLAADAVGDARFGHKVALVGGVYEHFGADDAAGLEVDRGETGADLFDGTGEIEALAAEDGELVFADVVLEDFFGDVGLERPHGGFAGVGGGLADAAGRSPEVAGSRASGRA